MEESSRWIWAQPADFVTRRAAPLSPIGELQVMVADRQRQLVDLTGAIDRIDDTDILAQRADRPRWRQPRGVSQIGGSERPMSAMEYHGRCEH